MKPQELIENILQRKRESIETLKSKFTYDELAARSAGLPPTRGFAESLKGRKPLAVIAELKKASPSKGLIRPDFKPVEIAMEYERAGASAISVLTEEFFFLGNPDYLAMVRERVSLPLLRKEFIMDPIQIPETRLLGADAVLLIVAFLAPALLKDLYDRAKKMGLDVLVEVHDEAELRVALDIGAELIGINNRNLKTFEVDVEISFRLLSMIDSSRIVVSESGIHSPDQIQRLSEAGVSAVLVGESLMRSDDITGKLRQLLGN